MRMLVKLYSIIVLYQYVVVIVIMYHYVLYCSIVSCSCVMSLFPSTVSHHCVRCHQDHLPAVAHVFDDIHDVVGEDADILKPHASAETPHNVTCITDVWCRCKQSHQRNNNSRTEPKTRSTWFKPTFSLGH